MQVGQKYQDLDLVFATELGTPLLWRNLAKRHLKPLLIAAGIPDEGISLYSLRHTHASLRIINGDNIRVIAEDMGTSIAMIVLTYSHVPRTLQDSLLKGWQECYTATEKPALAHYSHTKIKGQPLR